jgi:hypothetical protein
MVMILGLDGGDLEIWIKVKRDFIKNSIAKYI